MSGHERATIADGGGSARTASEHVAEQLRARIATGSLRPGDVLPTESVLLERFGVARPTMREALRILESDGLVTIHRGMNGGARVQEPDVKKLARRAGLYLQLRGADLVDLLQAQAILQPGAVALAAVARSTEDVAALRKVVEEVEGSADPVEFADAAAAFLDLLLHVSHNKMLALMSELTEELLHAELRTGLSTASAPEGRDIIRWSAKQYARLVDLIEEGETDLAEAFWREHLRVTRPYHNELSPLEVYRPWRRQDPVQYPWQGAQD